MQELDNSVIDVTIDNALQMDNSCSSNQQKGGLQSLSTGAPISLIGANLLTKVKNDIMVEKERNQTKKARQDYVGTEKLEQMTILAANAIIRQNKDLLYNVIQMVEHHTLPIPKTWGFLNKL